MPFIRSISGVRATLGDSLTPQIIAEYCAAFSNTLPDGAIVVGRDGRPSGTWVEQVVAGALASCGREVRILGMVPTPTVQLLTEHSDAVGGISITASHNPAPWNGLKFINSDGIFLNAEENQRMWNVIDSGNFTFLKEQHRAIIKNIDDASDRHIQSILDLPIFKNELLEKVKSRRLKAVVDAVNASGSVIVPKLLKALGCEVVELFCEGTGEFPHMPEPLPENLKELAAAVLKEKADIGIAVDPDADRLVLIDENGHAIGEERTITLSVLSVMSSLDHFKNSHQPAASVNLSTTRAVEDVAAQFGATVERAPVGEINVIGAMKSCNAIIGGEGSGGVILPACHYGRDSLVGIALVLHLMDFKNQTLSEICAELPKYEMVKLKKEFTGAAQELFKKVEEHFKTAKIDKRDGIKVDFERSWVHLRTSNTEPIVRAIAEAPTKAEAEELANLVLGFVE